MNVYEILMILTFTTYLLLNLVFYLLNTKTPLVYLIILISHFLNVSNSTISIVLDIYIIHF
jgi:hypothetical protein